MRRRLPNKPGLVGFAASIGLALVSSNCGTASRPQYTTPSLHPYPAGVRAPRFRLTVIAPKGEVAAIPSGIDSRGSVIGQAATSAGGINEGWLRQGQCPGWSLFTYTPGAGVHLAHLPQLATRLPCWVTINPVASSQAKAFAITLNPYLRGRLAASQRHGPSTPFIVRLGSDGRPSFHSLPVLWPRAYNVTAIAIGGRGMLAGWYQTKGDTDGPLRGVVWISGRAGYRGVYLNPGTAGNAFPQWVGGSGFVLGYIGVAGRPAMWSGPRAQPVHLPSPPNFPGAYPEAAAVTKQSRESAVVRVIGIFDQWTQAHIHRKTKLLAWRVHFSRHQPGWGISSISAPRPLPNPAGGSYSDGTRALAENRHGWVIADAQVCLPRDTVVYSGGRQRHGCQEGSAAYLWYRGQPYNLNRLLIHRTRWHLEGSTGINDRGQIIGLAYPEGSDPNSDPSRAFILTPVETRTH